MKAKLIKLEDDKYDLLVESNLEELKNTKLSLKNCQAIERGYDVYELAKENYHKFWSVGDESEMLDHTFGYVEGFQKALELMGDKKFTEDDLGKAIEYGHESKMPFNEDWYDNFIQSLQQNEWEVEIEMEEVSIGDKYTPDPKPKLDADGCLILKRV